MNRTKLGWFILLPALAMWLGWGIRGQMGHADGAMIPGALAGLALCVLLAEKRFSRGLAVGLAAVAFGFGADETTLESAGLVMHTIHHYTTATALTGYIGLAVKGALWPLFGGACLGLAFAASRYRRKDIAVAAGLMIAPFYAGWALINRPKLLYFSVTRHEIWGGLLFAAIALTVWLTVRGRTRIPLVLALCAAVAGGIGYPVAVTLAGAGMHSSHVGMWYDWWKVAETTFGAFMGIGLGVGAYLVRDSIPDVAEPVRLPAGPGRRALGMIGGVVFVAICTALYHRHVLPWIILGSALICIAYFSVEAAWHLAVTMTFYASAANVVRYWLREQHLGNAVVLWTLVVIAALCVAWRVSGWWAEGGKVPIRSVFLFLMWVMLALSYLKTFVNHAALSAPAASVAAAGGRWSYTLEAWGSGLTVDACFTIVALVLTWTVYRVARQHPIPEDKSALRASEALT
ncbi:MAG: hypothetical protein ACRD1N_00320 [Terriglobia bacterium]